MIAKIFDEQGAVINTVVADPAWLDQYYEGRWEPIEAPPKPEPTLSELKEQLKEKVTEYRWVVETSGVNVNGIELLTDTEDQDRVSNAVVSSLEPIDFKTPLGWTTIDQAGIKQIVQVIGLHVQQCSSAERRHHDAIDLLGSKEELESYDITINWPSRVKTNE